MAFPDFTSFLSKKNKIAVVGLGYTGLPLALAFGRQFAVIGFDKDASRVCELEKRYDRRGEARVQDFEGVDILFSSDPKVLNEAKLIIVTVPTPIDSNKIPNLSFLEEASATIGMNLAPYSIVVYESTVYPGVTEEICVPILESTSGLKFLESFKVGYSPERINPGDAQHSLENVVKVVAGCDEEIVTLLEKIYGSVVKAGVYRAQSIKVAEAAKVIENAQRDLNIAFVNELSIIFHAMGIDTREVLKAAGTKWNFLPFEPGLVGGHCIGVDPYYLAFKAESLGYHPQVILAGRRVNDYMGKYVAEQTVKMMIKTNGDLRNARVLIMGFAFKENVKDTRNSKVFDIYKELREYGIEVCVYDPVVLPDEVKSEYGIDLIDSVESHSPYDAIIFAVKHNIFKGFGVNDVLKLFRKKPIVVDVKSMFNPSEFPRDCVYWRL